MRRSYYLYRYNIELKGQLKVIQGPSRRLAAIGD